MERTPIEPSSASFADNLTAQEPMDASPDPFRVGSMQAPQDLLADGRRAFLGAATFLALVACAPKQDVPILTSSSRRPDAIWDSGPSVAATAAPAPPIKSDQAAKPTVSPKTTSSGPAALGWAKPRALWAQAAPEISLMNPMLPVTSVTVHHDGLDKLETGIEISVVRANARHRISPHHRSCWDAMARAFDSLPRRAREEPQ